MSRSEVDEPARRVEPDDRHLAAWSAASPRAWPTQEAVAGEISPLSSNE